MRIKRYNSTISDPADFSLSADGTKAEGVKTGKYRKMSVPDGVREITKAAFRNLCVNYVILPDGVWKIGENAFYGCERLLKIYIPESVKEIGDDVFCGCKHLEIYCEGKPQEGWLDKAEEKRVYYEDMTDAFNFHRSSGSFDDHYIVERVEIKHNNYNPERRPVHTEVSRAEFLKLIEEK